MMRIIAGTVLFLAIGSLVTWLWLVSGDIFVENLYTILFVVYILVSLFFLIVAAINNTRFWYNITARSIGGFTIKARLDLASATQTRISRFRLYATQVCEYFLIALSWPLLALLSDGYKKFASTMRARQTPASYLFVTLTMNTLFVDILRIAVVLLTLLMLLVAIHFVPVDKSGQMLFVNLFSIVTLLFLIKIVASPVDIATLAKRQHFDQYTTIVSIHVLLAMLIVVVFGALHEVNVIFELDSLFIITNELLSIKDAPFSSIAKYADRINLWLLSVTVLFSAGMFTSIKDIKQLERTDEDYIFLAEMYTQIGDTDLALHCLKRVKAGGNESVRIRSLNELINENRDIGKELMDRYILQITHDWPNTVSESLKNIFYIQAIAPYIHISKDYILDIINSSKPERMIEVISMVASLYNTGRFSKSEIVQATSHLSNEYKAAVSIFFALKWRDVVDFKRHYSKFDLANLGYWPSSDLSVICYWSLISELGLVRSKEEMLRAVHHWCSNNALLMRKHVRSAIAESDTFGILFCSTILLECKELLHYIAPLDSNLFSDLLDECNQYMNSFSNGSKLATVIPTLYKKARENLHENPL